ncbi:FG-GAP repeat domain-containing protein [Streptomyces sp. 24-1644]|uniref:FG-GAP repeat domain-containing protein n=1 Tax=Streptomyces sp. 24-1644 TaxID=3457315 RepID=UPI003FA69B49
MLDSRFHTASAVFVALAATAVAAPLAFSGTAVATGPVAVSGQRVDFNGDGYEDMFAPVPEGTVSGVKKAGYIAVYLGDATGISPARYRVISQNSSGVPGAVTENARFGAGRAADIDGDGYTDLLASSAQGARIILFGGTKGLATRAVEFHGQGDAVGDFDGDGRTDVAGIDQADWGGKIVVSENIGADGSVESTRTALTADGITVFESVQAVDMNNDSKDDLLVRSGCSDEPDCDGTSLYLSTGTGFKKTPILAAPGTYLSHSSVTVGSVNGDAYPDLVFTRQPTGLDSDLDFPSKGGAVAVVYGGPEGQNTTLKPKWITQSTAGVPGADEIGDSLGASAAVKDLDGDGYGEVVVGLPGEDVDKAKDAGGCWCSRAVPRASRAPTRR